MYDYSENFMQLKNLDKIEQEIQEYTSLTFLDLSKLLNTLISISEQYFLSGTLDRERLDKNKKNLVILLKKSIAKKFTDIVTEIQKNKKDISALRIYELLNEIKSLSEKYFILEKHPHMKGCMGDEEEQKLLSNAFKEMTDDLQSLFKKNGLKILEDSKALCARLEEILKCDSVSLQELYSRLDEFLKLCDKYYSVSWKQILEENVFLELKERIKQQLGDLFQKELLKEKTVIDQKAQQKYNIENYILKLFKILDKKEKLFEKYNKLEANKIAVNLDNKNIVGKEIEEIKQEIKNQFDVINSALCLELDSNNIYPFTFLTEKLSCKQKLQKLQNFKKIFGFVYETYAHFPDLIKAYTKFFDFSPIRELCELTILLYEYIDKYENEREENNKIAILNQFMLILKNMVVEFKELAVIEKFDYDKINFLELLEIKNFKEFPKELSLFFKILNAEMDFGLLNARELLKKKIGESSKIINQAFKFEPDEPVDSEIVSTSTSATISLKASHEDIGRISFSDDAPSVGVPERVYVTHISDEVNLSEVVFYPTLSFTKDSRENPLTSDQKLEILKKFKAKLNPVFLLKHSSPGSILQYMNVEYVGKAESLCNRMIVLYDCIVKYKNETDIYKKKKLLKEFIEILKKNMSFEFQEEAVKRNISKKALQTELGIFWSVVEMEANNSQCELLPDVKKELNRCSQKAVTECNKLLKTWGEDLGNENEVSESEESENIIKFNPNPNFKSTKIKEIRKKYQSALKENTNLHDCLNSAVEGAKICHDPITKNILSQENNPAVKIIFYSLSILLFPFTLVAMGYAYQQTGSINFIAAMNKTTSTCRMNRVLKDSPFDTMQQPTTRCIN